MPENQTKRLNSLGGVMACVALNERGMRIGEYHHRATVSDATVDRIREMREDRGLSYGIIARLLKLKRHYIAKICTYQIRCTTPDRWSRV